MASRILGRGKTAVRWNGDKVGDQMEDIAKEVMADKMLDARIMATNSLWPGHGVDTGTMKRRVHVAPGGHNWQAEHIKPATSTPELPDNFEPAKLRGKWTLELGVGQKYAMYFHQRNDPFLRRAFDNAMRGYKAEVQAQWRASFQ